MIQDISISLTQLGPTLPVGSFQLWDFGDQLPSARASRCMDFAALEDCNLPRSRTFMNSLKLNRAFRLRRDPRNDVAHATAPAASTSVSSSSHGACV